MESGHGIQFAGVETKAQTLAVDGKVDFPLDHPFLEHFKFVKANTRVTPKMTIPSPTVLHFRGGRKAISKDVYPDMAGFFDDTEIKKRIGEAAKFAPLEQFCLSPQCGFASTEEGNILTEDQQWAKMREIVDEVWGK